MKSVEAELKLVLSHNHGYFLRFQDEGIDRAQNFPMICGKKLSSWSDLLDLNHSKSSEWDRIESCSDFAKLEN